MHGSRDAMSRGLGHIEEQVKSIEKAVVENAYLAFDLAKVLIESTCRTVLSDRSIPYAEEDDLPRLFRSVRDNLPFLPATASDASDVRRSLAKTLGGLSTTVQGICELRNKCGFATHGRESAPPVMETVQAFLAAAAADAIVGFLYSVHRQNSNTRRIAGFEDNGDFNESLDEAHGPFLIDDVEFRPSEVLYQLEPETYRIYLAEFENTTGSETREATDGEGPP